MSFLSIRKSAWDQIKAAVADAADTVTDRAGDLRDAAADAHDRVHAQVKAGASSVADAVSSGASASADAIKGGVAAAGQGVGAVGDKVESVANGVIAGAIAGAFAAWVMNRYQAADAAMKSPGTEPATDAQAAAAQSGGSSHSASEVADGSGDNATVQVAQQLSRNLLGTELKEGQKESAGTAVQYGYGAAMGALYGGLTELVPTVGMGLGIPYATCLWLFGDEIATAALGIGKKPTETAPAEHATAFASHLVYGVTLDVSRRVLRHIV